MSKKAPVPLSVVYQSAEHEIHDAVMAIIKKYGIPMYLADGIMTSIMLEIREAKASEILGECMQMINSVQDPEERKANDHTEVQS